MQRQRSRRVVMIVVAALTSVLTTANAVPVTSQYIQKSASEISGMLGRYAQPRVYVNQMACGEPQLSAVACGPYTISVGSQFLNSIESRFGNYTAKAVLAHEWGHSIQFSYGIRLNPPYQELQADCVGGSFIRYAETTLRYPSFIAGAANSARAAADYREHGTPSQRDYHTRAGYSRGFNYCFS
ncbi:neutral zinc metallopeptidase [Chitinivorax sp. B]|uniref:neutral zinc metallopeptidase n=1 Tax=Chitinivorax sp. B TaxID=2502235 RepID=UPI002016D2D0|nr:neutral zinc metallopeptidase [Chitinivorax sp. B]